MWLQLLQAKVLSVVEIQSAKSPHSHSCVTVVRLAQQHARLVTPPLVAKPSRRISMECAGVSLRPRNTSFHALTASLLQTGTALWRFLSSRAPHHDVRIWVGSRLWLRTLRRTQMRIRDSHRQCIGGVCTGDFRSRQKHFEHRGYLVLVGASGAHDRLFHLAR